MIVASVVTTAVVVLGAVGFALQLRSEAEVPVAEDVPAVEVATSGPVELTPAELAAAFGDAVWRVEAEGCGVASSGTAFAVDEHTLVTNWHVTVIDADPVLVSRDGETRLEGRVIGWSERPDVAIIEVEEPLTDTLDWVGAGELAEGQAIVALGYPVPATDFTVTPANILSFQVEDGARQAIRADGALDKGNSGGPALTTTGEVAGVVTEMATSEGFQIVPLVYTHDHLADTIAGIIEDGTGVASDCDSMGARPELPEGWDDWERDRPDSSYAYGDDPALDRLWDRCEAGDMAACDELYFISPLGSEYEAFGGSCGGRDATWGWCEELDQSGSTSRAAPDVASEPQTRGDDAGLDRLWDSCATEDWTACDDLYIRSPYGSRYEAFGGSCGDRIDGTSGSCEYEMQTEPAKYGDDRDLDRLWDRCASGNWASCDELYFSAPLDSRYESYGSTCGDRGPETYGDCEWERS